MVNQKTREGGSRVEFINPLFKDNEIVKPKKIEERVIKKTDQIRAVRNDKTHNIKFPVTPIVQLKLKSHCKQAARLYRGLTKESLSQTKFNTFLLRYGLKNDYIQRWDHEYKDTKVYMHTNILETEYEEIGGPHGLSVRKGLSDRKVVYQVMLSVLNWLEGGGEIEKIIQQS
jgi:hypothetical protein